MNKLKIKGKFVIEHWRGDEKIGEYPFPNAVCDAGMNSILDTMFDSATQVATWYIGLINNASFSALAPGDIISSHSGWIEFTGYSESVRQTWGVGSAASRSSTNASPAVFSITSAGTLNGAFLVTDSTKGGTSGLLWATGSFTSNINVANGDSLRVTYTVSG